ncbi:MAG: ATP-binding cassette domain-containing protein [Lachnospiraceae bacterium]|nr:ATP-binding cassette domain-containing protein [Lachnospiraceae bacterium]
MNIIETENLTKTYRRFVKPEGLSGSIRSLWRREYEEKSAVRNFDFTLEEGEFIGLIGPNGAGKTTLTKMLTGIIAPTSGRISVMGFYPNDLKNEFKRQYAVVMGQKSQLFFELTTNDTMRLFKEIYEMDEKQFQETKAYFAELFDVKELMDVQVRTLSLGERMKMELMVALLHGPRVLFLDEPSIGLDAIASNQIRKFLKQVNQEKGTSIILTSHYMEDISTLCQRSVVIHHGCKVYDGKTEELFAKYQKNKKITACFSKELPGEISLPMAQILERTPHKLVFMVPREESGAALAAVMPWNPADISVEEDEIGTVVERIYQEGSRYEN